MFKIQNRHSILGNYKAAAILLLVIGLTGYGCDAGRVAPAATPTRVAAGGAIGAAATPAEGKGVPQGKLNCQAIADAALDLNTSVPILVMLSGAGGSVQNRVDSPMYVDTSKLRADLVVLAALPDPTDAMEATVMGKPSEAIPQFRQLFDIIDRDASANPTPVDPSSTTGGADDQKLLEFGTKFIKMSTSINAALASACPGVSGNVSEAVQPGAQATLVAASYEIGQTAAVGDVRVTLDRVVTSSGAGNILPTPGNRYLFAYFTVENKGKNAFRVNMLTGTHWEDSAGKQYTFDPNTIMLDPNMTNFDADIQPGAKQSGAIGYQLPRNAEGLVWVFQDFKPNRAAFSVKASDIADVGTPVTEQGADEMRASAAATQTAFVDMILGAEATQESAGTETPVPDEPVATDVPADATEAPANP